MQLILGRTIYEIQFNASLKNPFSRGNARFILLKYRPSYLKFNEKSYICGGS